MGEHKRSYELYGAISLVVAAVLVLLSILMFKQTFTDKVPVTMHISRAGLQLLPGSDVKLRGLIVGDVKRITSDGDGAEIDMRIKPSEAERIPANVSARLVPKTIFGEKYVALMLPRHPQGHLESGSVIPEDRSRPALEINQALDDLLPLLRTVRPEELNSTLSALATALDGKGDELGRTLVRLRDYARAINPQLSTLGTDLSLTADVANGYADAAPALLHLLRNVAATSDTIVTQRQALTSLLDEVSGAETTTRELLARTASDMITVNRQSRPTVAMLAHYSPEYPCFLRGIGAVVDRIHGAQPATGPQRFGPKVTLEFLPPKHAYSYPDDLPEFADRRGPNCYGLPHPPASLPQIHYKDGTGPDHGGSVTPSRRTRTHEH